MIKHKKTLTALVLSTAFTLSACEKEVDQPKPTIAPEQQATQSPAIECIDPKKTDTTEPNPASSESNVAIDEGNFDINKFPLANTNVGSFPYISVPEGFIIVNNNRNGADTGYTKFYDFSKLVMYTGESFFDAEGKRADLKVSQPNKEPFNQYKFDKSVDSYLESIGAVAIFKGRIPNAKLKELNKENSSTVYDYIIGDPWNTNPVKHYVLNHTKGKIMFQVWSNSAQAEIGVVELEGFKQTIQAPTASQIQKRHRNNGQSDITY